MLGLSVLAAIADSGLLLDTDEFGHMLQLPLDDVGEYGEPSEQDTVLLVGGVGLERLGDFVARDMQMDDNFVRVEIVAVVHVACKIPGKKRVSGPPQL